MKIRLELVHKSAKVKKVVLKADTIIGRSTECALRIASNEISRQHCKICLTEDGVTVRDLGSSNGTFVNGYQLEADTDYEIAPDSELSLGGVKFIVRFNEPEVKVMEGDGLGSTVDLKPNPSGLSGAVELAKSIAETSLEESVQYGDGPPLVETIKAETTEDQKTLDFVNSSDAGLLAEEPAIQMSTHGDSAILVRDGSDGETLTNNEPGFMSREDDEQVTQDQSLDSFFEKFN